MTDLRNLPLSHPLFHTISDGNGGMQKCLCLANDVATSTEIATRARIKKLLRQLGRSTDPTRNDELATEIIRLQSKLKNGTRRDDRREARISADRDVVKKAHRNVAVALAANPNEERTMEPTFVFDETWELETLEKIVADPACSNKGRRQLSALIEKMGGAGAADDEDMGIAASHGGRIREDSFVKHCQESYARQKRN